MKLSFAEFSQLKQPAHVVIHSLEQALYQVTVDIDGKQCLLVENSGKTFRCHSLQRAREALRNYPVASLTLRQQSAYDEMVGQPVREQDNVMEVSLSLDQYPPTTLH